MWIRSTLAALALLSAACGTYSVFERFEPKPEGLSKAASLLESKQPEAAQRQLLSMVPAGARVLLQTADVNQNGTYITDLASAMAGVPDGANILSMYATSEAEITGVGTLNIIVELVKIDKEKKSASLALVDTSEDDAIGLFFPAMPAACKSNFAGVHLGLDKANAIILATGILRGFPAADVATRIRELRASLASSDLLNLSIFSLVSFICPILQYDASGDFTVDEGEAAAISDDGANALYTRMQSAIDAIQAMVDANPGDKNLDKALTRCKTYKEKIDAMPAELSIPLKVREFLVSQTRKKT